MGGIYKLRKLRSALDKLGGLDALENELLWMKEFFEDKGWLYDSVGSLYALAAMEDVVDAAGGLDALEKNLLPLKPAVEEAGVEQLQEMIALGKAVKGILGGTQEDMLSQLAILSPLIKDAGSAKKLEEKMRPPSLDAAMRSMRERSMREVNMFLPGKRTEKSNVTAKLSTMGTGTGSLGNPVRS